jgi:hypothetical protein
LSPELGDVVELRIGACPDESDADGLFAHGRHDSSAAPWPPGPAITTPEGRFTADVAGAAGAPLVLLLHGFPQSRHSWREQIRALSAVGYRAVAEHRRSVSVEDSYLITIVTARLNVKTRQGR